MAKNKINLPLDRKRKKIKMNNMQTDNFEKFIIKCCAMREWNLRKFLKYKLTEAGFQIIEDDYKSYRGGKYNEVHNMLAIRGENPRVCLVNHSDTCRDHNKNGFVPNVNPVVKMRGDKRIIQDKECKYQTGGDDRLGIAIDAWICLNTGYDLGFLLTTDEEVGLVSAEYVEFPELMKFDLLAEVDRGNNSNQLVTSIAGLRLCDKVTEERLLNISKEINLPRYSVNGLITDVYSIKHNGICKNAVNMTCGYHNSYGSSADEFISVAEAKETLRFVSSIVQYYYLSRDKEESGYIENVKAKEEKCYQFNYYDKEDEEDKLQQFLKIEEELFNEEQYYVEKK